MDIFTIVLIILVALISNQIGYGRLGAKGINMLDALPWLVLFIICYFVGEMIQIVYYKVMGKKRNDDLISKTLSIIIGLVILVIYSRVVGFPKVIDDLIKNSD